MADPAEMLSWPKNASEEYVAARRELLAAEESLLDQIKQVTEMRRSLPLGAPMAPYAFAEGPRDLDHDDPVATTMLANLVGERGLFVYHMMFAPDWDDGCPSCSMWLDGLNGVSQHLAQVVDFVVVAKAPVARLRGWARKRGWHGLRLLSSHDNTFNMDLYVEDSDGGQWPRVSTFVKRDGVVHHSYTVGMIDNSMDLLSPVWHAEDLLPQGRGDWEPGNSYISGGSGG